MDAVTQAPAWRVALADTTIGAEEIEAVTAVLASRWLSAGPVTAAFEREFAAALGAPGAVAVSSGTAALHLAMLALPLEGGAEVIVPSLTFVASASAAVLRGARPVFADVRSESDLTIDPEHVRELVTPRTRAIVVMHYGGFPCDMEALSAIACDHGIPLIEDAAHAPAVRAGGRMLGTVGDIGCFSFHVAKNVTTGEGGMVVAADPEVLAQVRMLRSHCVTASSWDRARGTTTGYDVVGAGLNYRPTEISSAIGRVQLGRLAADRRCRETLVAAYRAGLARVPGLVLPFAEHRGDAAHHLLAVLLPAGAHRAAVQAGLREAGVQTSVHYPPTHQLSFYARAHPAGPLPVTDAVAGRLLSLPLHARMTVEDVEHVIGALERALR